MFGILGWGSVWGVVFGFLTLALNIAQQPCLVHVVGL